MLFQEKFQLQGLCENDYFGNGVTSDYVATDFKSSSEECNVHKRFKIDISTGKLANEFCPADQVKEIVLAVDPETGEILNKPSDSNINIHETCDVHNALNSGKKITGSDESDQDPIGSVIPDFTENNKPNSNSGSTDSNPDSGNTNNDNYKPTESNLPGVIGGDPTEQPTDSDLYLPQ